MDKYCTNCGKVLGMQDSFCKECATPVNRNKSISLKPKRLEKKFLLGGIAALVTVMLLLVFFSKNNNEESKPFQLIAGDEVNYLYYNNILIELDEKINKINYDYSFIFNNTAFLDVGGSIVLVDLVSHDYEVLEGVNNYSVSQKEGIVAYLDRDVVAWRDLMKIYKEYEIVDDVEQFISNAALTRFYVKDERGVLSCFDRKGKLLESDIVEGAELLGKYFVVNDQYLIYEGKDIYVYDMKSKKTVERFKNERLYHVYASENSKNYIIETLEKAIVISDNEVKKFDKKWVLLFLNEGSEMAIIADKNNDALIFNLNAMNGVIEYDALRLEEYRIVKNSFFSFERGDNDLNVYDFKNGKPKSEKSKIKLKKDIEHIFIYDENHLVYSDEDKVLFYNGKKEFEMDFDAALVKQLYFDEPKGIYYILEDEVIYMRTNGETNSLFDAYYIKDSVYNHLYKELLVLDDEDDLYVINNSREVNFIEKDVDAIAFSNGTLFYYMGDALYAFSNGKSHPVGRNLRVAGYNMY